MANRWGNNENSGTDFIFLDSITTGMVTAAMKLKTLAPWKKNYDKPRQYIKSKDITLSSKICIVQAMVFPVVIYRYESWTIKKAEH